ncbi:MAG TPA: sigma-54 dependent transcriptional regulator [Fibrobacteria bacterium]|nr:sigma-54 dependent transcriptional regulator [Fibrobacteria bacterium]
MPDQRKPTDGAPRPHRLNILIVDDEANIRKTLAMALEVSGHRVTAVSNGKDGLLQASMQSFDLIFLDLRLGTEKGTDYIPEFIATSPWIKIVVITAHATVETAVEAIRRGAVDYLPKPFTPAQVKAIVDRAAETKRAEAKEAALRMDESVEPGTDLDSKSPAMQRVLALARQVAPTEAGVLIRGESGTGKSVLARLIHSWSARSSKHFGVVSCPTLSPELLESELFGHAKGAFTGALRDHPGRIAALNGGTLFLDEIGDLPVQVQPKLLRFLQDREYERVGGTVTHKADIRVLAASNLDLEGLARVGRFREDLLYRLNVFQIELPPLRDRVEDIPILAHRFLAFYAGRYRKQFLGFSEEALVAMKAHPWVGNIRELRNVIERTAIIAQGSEIGPLEMGLKRGAGATPIQIGAAIPLDTVEEAHIRHVLASTKSLEEAARILGIDAATLWRRRKKYGI